MGGASVLSSRPGPGPAPTQNSGDDDGGGGLVASQVREIIAGVIVSGILTLVGTTVGLGIDVIGTIRSALTNAGAGIASDAGNLGTDFIDLVVETPLEVIGDLAASSSIFAPVVSALIFALVTAMAAAIVYGLWRAIVVIT